MDMRKKWLRMFVLAIGWAAGFLLLTTSPVYADNCGSVSDCFNTIAIAIAALVGLVILIALAAIVLPAIFAATPEIVVAVAEEEVAAEAAAAAEAEAAAAAEGAATEGAAVEPGAWSAESESMSDSAAQYQEQITGHTTDEVYRVGDVKFDGYQDGKLLDAKGPGYQKFFDSNGDPKPWWNGAKSLVDQAERQVAAANGTPIEW